MFNSMIITPKYHQDNRSVETKRIEVMDWPNQSPDLSPLEDLWRKRRRRVAKQQTGNLKVLETCYRCARQQGFLLKLLSHVLPADQTLISSNDMQISLLCNVFVFCFVVVVFCSFATNCSFSFQASKLTKFSR